MLVKIIQVVAGDPRGAPNLEDAFCSVRIHRAKDFQKAYPSGIGWALIFDIKVLWADTNTMADWADFFSNQKSYVVKYAQIEVIEWDE